MPETNPLVAERKDTTTPLAGTFLLEDGEALVQAINDKDWVAGGLAVVGGAFDAAAAASDPIGTLIAMGLGWVLDHVHPSTPGSNNSPATPTKSKPTPPPGKTSTNTSRPPPRPWPPMSPPT
jgi:YD repeat protein